MPLLQTGDAKIYYEAVGTGESVIFLHGIALDSRMWNFQFHLFKKHFNVLRYDLRHYGKSTAVSPSYHTEDLKTLLDNLELQQVHMVGLSRGGRIAIDFTLEFPDRVKTLCLLSSALTGFRFSNAVAARQKKLAKVSTEDISRARSLWIQESIFKCACENGQTKVMLESMVNSYSGIHWIKGFQNLELWKWKSSIDRLHEIKCRTLVMYGGRDAQYFRFISEIIASGIPNAQMQRYGGVGHLINIETPQLFNTNLYAFLTNEY